MSTNIDRIFLGEGATHLASIQASSLTGGAQEEIAIQIKNGEDADDAITVTKTFTATAIKALVKSIGVVGPPEKQIGKISPLLVLAKHASIPPEERKEYFYQAVSLAEQYLGKGLSDNKTWSDIVFIYKQFIHDTISTTDGYRDSIRLNSMIHRNQEIEAAKNTKTYLSGMTHPQEILDKLERLIGPVRLIITSQDSGEVLIRHNIDQGDIGIAKNMPITLYTIEVSIFNRKKKYTIAIDHGNNETSNQIKPTDWNDYIKTIIDIYIERMEELSSQRQHSNLKKIQQQEVKEGMRILSLDRDYSIFLSRVIRSIDPELIADESYIQDCIRAIDICRVITLRHSRSLAKNAPDIPQLNTIDTISQEIDTILDSRITRRVLRMVTAMLLSRDETMNGLGYPSGLNKDNIHTLGKVLSIIRVYESMCLDKSPQDAIEMMSSRSKGGYWDTRVLELFLDTLGEGAIGKLASKESTQQKSITPYRQRVYEPSIQSWENIVATIADIEKQYTSLRDPKSKDTMRSAIILTIKALQAELVSEADIRKIIIIARHAETESDKKGGKKPGGNDEGLTKRGIRTTYKIGKGFQGLNLDIHTSPTVRGEATAKVICESSQRAVSFVIESALRNRSKGNENDFGDSFLGRIMATHPEELIRLIKSISLSTKHDQVLLISHADSIKAMDAIMKALNQEDGIHVAKISVKNNTTLVYFIRGGQLIAGDYFFTIATWRSVTKQINTIIKKIFNESLYPADMQDVDLFDLHDQFLDYIDDKNETVDQEKVGKLIQALDDNPLTAHLSAVLRKEGKIK